MADPHNLRIENHGDRELGYDVVFSAEEGRINPELSVRVAVEDTDLEHTEHLYPETEDDEFDYYSTPMMGVANAIDPGGTVYYEFVGDPSFDLRFHYYDHLDEFDIYVDGEKIDPTADRWRLDSLIDRLRRWLS